MARVRHRFAYALLLAILATAVAPAGAGDHHRERPERPEGPDRPDRQAMVTLEDETFAGLAAGTLSQYQGTTWIQIRLRADQAVDEAVANEWALELYADRSCSGALLTSLTFTNPPAYGPRVFERVDLPLRALGSVLLVHDGPTFLGHADTPGRHPLACASLDRRSPDERNEAAPR